MVLLDLLIYGAIGGFVGFWPGLFVSSVVLEQVHDKERYREYPNWDQLEPEERDVLLHELRDHQASRVDAVMYAFIAAGVVVGVFLAFS